MRSTLKRVLPAPFLRAFKTRAGPKPVKKSRRVDLPYEERFPARYDTAFFDIGDGLTLAVYWKDLPLGRGPAFSIHAGASEPLKFDCFGKDLGHFHTEAPSVGPQREGRIWLPEPTRHEQVDRALFEIEKNAVYYISRSPWLAGQDLRPDPEKLSEACDKARRLAYRFIDMLPDAEDPPVKTGTAASA